MARYDDVAGRQPRRRAGRATRRATAVVAAATAVGLTAAGCTADSTPSSTAASGSTSPSGTASPGGTTSPGPAAAAGSTTAATGTGSLADVPQVAARLQPSVVTVVVDGGNGSGVVYSADGLILTNAHVVGDSREVRIAFADGQRVAGTVRATDPVTDLALVQADRRDLPPARFQTRLPAVGSLAIVLGSPLGFQNTVTAGIISGLHRDIPGSAAQGIPSLVDLIQTDAPISPGNSGGAVVDGAGQVTGISVAYIPPQSGAVALGFAVPAATAVSVADQLRRTGRAQHAFAGLVPSSITPEIAQQFGLADTDGVIITGLVAGGPAARAGLQPGDVITAVNGTPTRSPEEFLAALRARKPGDVLDLTVRRQGQDERRVRLTVVDRPATSGP